jgi:hypothetical protein
MALDLAPLPGSPWFSMAAVSFQVIKVLYQIKSTFQAKNGLVEKSVQFGMLPTHVGTFS